MTFEILGGKFPPTDKNKHCIILYVKGIFFPSLSFFVSHYMSQVFSSNESLFSPSVQFRLGNPKAVAHVAVDLQFWSLQSVS